MSANAPAAEDSSTPKFVAGSTMRHVVEMTATASVGLLAIFFVDFLSLLYVSWLGDKAATAGVGFASVVFFFAMSVNIGLMIAVSALMSKALGAGDRAHARELGASAMAIMLALSVAISILIIALLPVLLPLLGAQGRVYDIAHRFLLIALPSTPLMALGMGFSSALRAVGDARRAMNVTLIGAVATAVADPLLIFGFKLGVDGAAIATVISRIIFALVGWRGAVAIHDLIARPTFDMARRHARVVVAVAGPAVLTNLAAPFAISVVTRVTAQFGESAIAASAIIDRITPLAFGGVFALTGAIGPILGQNWGAGRFDRMRRAFLDSLIFVAVYVLSVWFVLIGLRDGLVQLFHVADLTADLLRFFTFASGPIWLFMGILFVANSTFNNLGFPLYATGFNWGRATIGTAPFAMLGAAWSGAPGVMVGFGVGAAIFSLGAMAVAWRCIARLERQAQPVEAVPVAA